MWTYLNVPESAEGTTLYMDGQPPYMEWIWEIPIHSDVISVGSVAASDAIREKRRRGQTVEEIFREQLARFPRFAELLRAGGAVSPHVTSFQCRTHSGLAGPNWLIVGEAASMVDLMTANGVTAALRHASEACALIIRSGRRKRLPYLAGGMYTRRVVDLGRFFNCGIERVIYDAAIRKRIGVLRAGRVYTVPPGSSMPCIPGSGPRAWFLRSCLASCSTCFEPQPFCSAHFATDWAALVRERANRVSDETRVWISGAVPSWHSHELRSLERRDRKTVGPVSVHRRGFARTGQIGERAQRFPEFEGTGGQYRRHPDRPPNREVARGGA